MFKQRAHGTTEFQVVPGTPHCGINDQTVTVDWKLELVFESDALDSNGFLVDNTAFKGYFTGMSTNPIRISCENLAKKIAHDVAEMAGDKLVSVSVVLSPFQGVEIEFILEPKKP
jgi:hypothetical protein